METQTTNTKNENVFIKKCSIFDQKQSKPLLDSIKEIVEGFHDYENSNSDINVNDVSIQLNGILIIIKPL